MSDLDRSELSPQLLLRDRDVAATLKISVRYVWQLVTNGQLPKPVRLGNCTRWRRSDIDEFVRRAADEPGTTNGSGGAS